MRLHVITLSAMTAALLIAFGPAAAFPPPDPKCADVSAEPAKLALCVASLDARLREQEQKLDDLDGLDDKKKDDPTARIAALEQKLADQQVAQGKLEARIDALESKPSPDGQAKDVPGGQTDPAALATRVAALEAKLNGKLTLKDLTVDGSLTVTAEGHRIFLVDRSANGDEGSFTQMSVDGEGAGNFLVTVEGEEVSAMARGAEQSDYTEMKRGDKGAQINVHQDSSNYLLLSYDTLFAGLQIADTTGAIANFGRNVQSGSTGARVLAGNQLLAALVATKAGQSAMSLAVKGKEDAMVGAAAGADGGTFYLAAGGKPVIELSAPLRRLALINGDQVIAALRKSASTEGGNVSTYDAAGGERFSAGSTSDGGAACVFRKDNFAVTCLGVDLPGASGGP